MCVTEVAPVTETLPITDGWVDAIWGVMNSCVIPVSPKVAYVRDIMIFNAYNQFEGHEASIDYVANHIERVSILAAFLAQINGDYEMAQFLRDAGALHDLGKLADGQIQIVGKEGLTYADKIKRQDHPTANIDEISRLLYAQCDTDMNVDNICNLLRAVSGHHMSAALDTFDITYPDKDTELVSGFPLWGNPGEWRSTNRQLDYVDAYLILADSFDSYLNNFWYKRDERESFDDFLTKTMPTILNVFNVNNCADGFVYEDFFLKVSVFLDFFKYSIRLDPAEDQRFFAPTLKRGQA